MKKLLHLMLAILLFAFVLDASYCEPASKRGELLQKIDQLALWCKENNEFSVE